MGMDERLAHLSGFFHTVVLILLNYLYNIVILAKTVNVIVTKTKNTDAEICKGSQCFNYILNKSMRI